jgi:multiple sugar transport system permease protein
MNLLGKSNLLEVILRRIIIVIVMIAFIAPVLLIILTSLKTRIDALAKPPVWIFKPTLSNYIHIFTGYEFGHFFRNSLIVGICTTFFAMVLSSLAAYAFARFRFRGSGALAYWILSLRMSPAIASIIPIFIMLRVIGQLDHLPGLILVYTAINLPLGIWILRGFYEDLPVEIEESALVDGCSRLGAFFRIAIPLTLPGLSATAILIFLFTWNEFLFALILTGHSAQTMPVAVTLFMRETGIDWGYMTAAATLMMLPTLISTVFIQKGLVRGLTLGAVK